jgi:hypothetical protein
LLQRRFITNRLICSIGIGISAKGALDLFLFFFFFVDLQKALAIKPMLVDAGDCIGLARFHPYPRLLGARLAEECSTAGFAGSENSAGMVGEDVDDSGGVAFVGFLDDLFFLEEGGSDGS